MTWSEGFLKFTCQWQGRISELDDFKFEKKFQHQNVANLP